MSKTGPCSDDLRCQYATTTEVRATAKYVCATASAELYLLQPTHLLHIGGEHEVDDLSSQQVPHLLRWLGWLG